MTMDSSPHHRVAELSTYPADHWRQSSSATVHFAARCRAPGLMHRVGPAEDVEGRVRVPGEQVFGTMGFERASSFAESPCVTASRWPPRSIRPPRSRQVPPIVGIACRNSVQLEIAVPEHEVARQRGQLVNDVGDRDVAAVDQDLRPTPPAIVPPPASVRPDHAYRIGFPFA